MLMSKEVLKLDQFISYSLQKDEINIKELIRAFFIFRKWILTIAFFVFALGLVYLVSSPEEYTSKSKLLLEQSGGFGGKSLGGLASISGLGNLGLGNQNSEALPAELIPELVMESDFLKELMYETIYLEDAGDSISLLRYVNEFEEHDFYYHLIRVPSKIKSRLFFSTPIDTEKITSPEKTLQEPEILSFESEERMTIGRLRERILVEKEERLLLIQTKMPDPVASAQLNAILVKNIKNYLTELSSEKELRNFEFIEKRTVEAKNRVSNTQEALARFRDSNRGINSQLVKTEEDRLVSDFNLEFNVYNSLAQQLEQARIKVQEASPMLTVFQKPQVPTSPSEPKFVLLGLAFLVLGFVLAILSFFVLLVFRILKLQFSDV